jgi:dTDP-4-amino-4,6-dideoxygalactose transaminase
VDPSQFGATCEDIRLALEKENIESRPVWKPMHMQPVYSQYRVRGGAVSEELFANGLCLPSGSSLTKSDLARIIGAIQAVHDRAITNHEFDFQKVSSANCSTVVLTGRPS